MSDLPAFVRTLAEAVAAHDPDAVGAPLPVGEIQTRMMPYRACRRALGLDTAEEYELLLLRLVAEESGLGRTDPPEAAERCRVEVASVLPDLAFLQELAEVTVLLHPGVWHSTTGETADRAWRPVEAAAAARTRDQEFPDSTRSDSAAPTADQPDEPANGAPPDVNTAARHEFRAAPPAEPIPPPSGSPMTDSAAAGSPPSPAAPLACPRCDRTLPRGRPVRFCPDCGQNVMVRLCPSCRSEMEPTWRHCVMCGHQAADASSFA